MLWEHYNLFTQEGNNKMKVLFLRFVRVWLSPLPTPEMTQVI